MRSVFSLLSALTPLLLWAGGAGAQPRDMQMLLEGEPRRLTLMKELSEVSGLAVATETSVLAHNDEHGIVYEIDLQTGEPVSVFALGDPTIRGDFEGIATNGDRVFLVTSTGLIYDAERGENGHRVKFNVYDTGVSDFCEVEGLDAIDAEGGEFIILCKTPTHKDYAGRLVIYRWSLSDRLPVDEPWINISHRDFLSYREREKFRPSAVEWDPDNERLIIISARNHMFVVLNDEGRLLYKQRLLKAAHRQAEGVALMTEALVIADESGGRGRGVMSIYKER